MATSDQMVVCYLRGFAQGHGYNIAGLDAVLSQPRLFAAGVIGIAHAKAGLQPVSHGDLDAEVDRVLSGPKSPGPPSPPDP
jgi:hypothetical protein